jgi:hypothetical protein
MFRFFCTILYSTRDRTLLFCGFRVRNLRVPVLMKEGEMLPYSHTVIQYASGYWLLR